MSKQFDPQFITSSHTKMAQLLNKSTDVFKRDRDIFIKELHHYHDTRGTKFRRLPSINGHTIDLYLLYTLVTSKGGYSKVNAKNEWDPLLTNFNLPASCVNGGVALKQIYLRYLDRYEKAHFHGDEMDRNSDDDEESSRHKRWSTTKNANASVSFSYNQMQHNVSDVARASNGLSTDLYKSSEHERIMLSLLSPLPNEQDFAINVCTLLSNEGKYSLKLDKCPRIIDVLLAHAGVFSHQTMRALFVDVYRNVRKQNLPSFWNEVLVDKRHADLMDEEKFTRRKTILPVLTTFVKKEFASPVVAPKTAKRSLFKRNDTLDNAKTSEKSIISGSQENQEHLGSDLNVDQTDCEIAHDDDENMDVDLTKDHPEAEPSDNHANESLEDVTVVEEKSESKVETDDPILRDLFNLGRPLGIEDYVGQRVLQIANIFRNLSFIESNSVELANNLTFLRFVCLCISSRWRTINQHGFDMLSNIACELTIKDPQRDRLSECVLSFITDGLFSDDRFTIISSLDVLNKLSQCEKNEDVLLRYLDDSTYNRICLFLTIHDIMLLIYTLECLYSLSSLGERACNAVMRVSSIIDTLVSLMTVEAQSYGTKACINMKVIETLPLGYQANANTTNANVNDIQLPAKKEQIYNVAQSTYQVMTPVTNIQAKTLVNPTPIVANSALHQQQTINMFTSSNLTQTSQTSYTVMGGQQTASQSVLVQSQNAQASTLLNNVQSQNITTQQLIQENEQFALAWLRATYEPEPNSTGKGIEQKELYRNYVNASSKIGRKGVIAPLHFPKCVRATFGLNAGPVLNNVDKLFYYEGIRARAVPLTINCITTTTLQPRTGVNSPKQHGPGRPRKNPLPQTFQSVQTVHVQSVLGNTDACNTNDVSSVSSTTTTTPPPCPPSPILKGQLLMPNAMKKDALSQSVPVLIKSDVLLNNQVSAHPHLSQALLGHQQLIMSSKEIGGGGGGTLVSPAVASLFSSVNASAGSGSSGVVSSTCTLSSPVTSTHSSNSSLIKSLLATKVNESVVIPSMSMRTVVANMDCTSYATTSAATSVVSTQVTQRQQKLQTINQLQTAVIQSTPVLTTVNASSNNKSALLALKSARFARVNGSRTDIVDSSQLNKIPPLAPLSGGSSICLDKIDDQVITIESDCSNSQEYKDDPSSTVAGVTFAGLINGEMDANKPRNQLMLADLLEKKSENVRVMPPGHLNGVLRIGEKGLELVENNDRSQLSDDVKIVGIVANNNIETINNEISVIMQSGGVVERSDSSSVICKNDLKRQLDDVDESPMKRAHFSSVIVENNGSLVNGSDDVSNHKNGDIHKDTLNQLDGAGNGMTANDLNMDLRVDTTQTNAVSDDVILITDSPGASQNLIQNPIQNVQSGGANSNMNSVLILSNNLLGNKNVSSQMNVQQQPISGTSSQVIDLVDDEPKSEVVEIRDEEVIGGVSSTAANLYAALAADVLGDDDLDDDGDVVMDTSMTQVSQPRTINQSVGTTNQPVVIQQYAMPGNKIMQQPLAQNQDQTTPGATQGPAQNTQSQQIIVQSGNRQLFVSPAQLAGSGASTQMLLTANGQLIQQGGHNANNALKSSIPMIINQAPGQQRVILNQYGQQISGNVQIINAQNNQMGSVLGPGQIGQMLSNNPSGNVQIVQQSQTPGHSATGIQLVSNTSTSTVTSATPSQMQIVSTPSGQQYILTSANGSGQTILVTPQQQIQQVQHQQVQQVQQMQMQQMNANQSQQQQPQTLLVTQQGGTKTIIILQQQNQNQTTTTNASGQKVIQQQMVVSPQVARQILQQVAGGTQQGAVQNVQNVQSSVQGVSNVQTMQNVQGVQNVVIGGHAANQLLQTLKSGNAQNNFPLNNLKIVNSPVLSKVTGNMPPNVQTVQLASQLVRTSNLDNSINNVVNNNAMDASVNSANSALNNVATTLKVQNNKVAVAGNVAQVPSGYTIISTGQQTSNQVSMATVQTVATTVNNNTATTVTTIAPNQLTNEQSTKLLTQRPSPCITPTCTTPPIVTRTIISGDLVFVCEWANCTINASRTFKSANEVLMHVEQTHMPVGDDEVLCAWGDKCDTLRRKRFSILTHVLEKHCTTEAMKASAARRKQMLQTGKFDLGTTTQTKTYPGYGPDAAMRAIKSNLSDYTTAKEQLPEGNETVVPLTAEQLLSSALKEQQSINTDENEGPVTKSIRLTSSLILRNLVNYSNTCKRSLRCYESHLANVAFSNAESARTAAQILADLNENR